MRSLLLFPEGLRCVLTCCDASLAQVPTALGGLRRSASGAFTHSGPRTSDVDSVPLRLLPPTPPSTPTAPCTVRTRQTSSATWFFAQASTVLASRAAAVGVVLVRGYADGTVVARSLLSVWHWALIEAGVALDRTSSLSLSRHSHRAPL